MQAVVETSSNLDLHSVRKLIAVAWQSAETASFCRKVARRCGNHNAAKVFSEAKISALAFAYSLAPNAVKVARDFRGNCALLSIQLDRSRKLHLPMACGPLFGLSASGASRTTNNCGRPQSHRVPVTAASDVRAAF